MARSSKRGIAYYTMDVDVFADRKIRRLVGACGAAAVAVMVRVLCAAYQERGYYIEAGDELYCDIAQELQLSEAFVKNAVSKCVEVGLFSEQVLGAHGVLTSARMQRNFLDATRKRRCHNRIDEKYRLVDAAAQPPPEPAPKPQPGEPKKDYGGVRLTKREYEDLAGRYGPLGAARMIEMLGTYKKACEREYDSDYRAIRAWVVRRYNEEVRDKAGVR